MHLQKFYIEEYFYYTGFPYCGTIPDITPEAQNFRYAILDENNDEKLIGYLDYYIDTHSDAVRNFGLYSFDKGNPIIGRDLFNKMEELIEKHHRLEWRMIGGNPVQRHYDRFCKKHNGNILVLHDCTKDESGNYHDEYIYEIVKDKKFNC